MSLKGYDIEKLSQATGIHRDTISNLLRNQTLPSYKVINILYYELDLTPEEGKAIFLLRNLRNKKVIFKKEDSI